MMKGRNALLIIGVFNILILETVQILVLEFLKYAKLIKKSSEVAVTLAFLECFWKIWYF